LIDKTVNIYYFVNLSPSDVLGVIALDIVYVKLPPFFFNLSQLAGGSDRSRLWVLPHSLIYSFTSLIIKI